MLVLHDVNNAALHVMTLWWRFCMLHEDFAVCLFR